MLGRRSGEEEYSERQEPQSTPHVGCRSHTSQHVNLAAIRPRRRIRGMQNTDAVAETLTRPFVAETEHAAIVEGERVGRARERRRLHGFRGEIGVHLGETQRGVGLGFVRGVLVGVEHVGKTGGKRESSKLRRDLSYLQVR